MIAILRRHRKGSQIPKPPNTQALPGRYLFSGLESRLPDDELEPWSGSEFRGRADLMKVFATWARCRYLWGRGFGRRLFTTFQPILGEKIIDDRDYLGDRGIVKVPR
jgi:hypothetical protein